MRRTGNVQEEAMQLIWSRNLKTTSIMFIDMFSSLSTQAS